MWYTTFIENDIMLLNLEAGNSCKVQNLSILEELAQIQYLFCDKTGTLTKNQLVFREMSVRDEIKTVVQEDSVMTNNSPCLKLEKRILQPSQSLDDIINCILICHDVLRIDGKLSGASQDELVMMQEIEDFYDSSLVARDSNSITVRIRELTEAYSIVKTYEFNSDRKMMSVTVLRQSDGQLINFAKGADMMIKKKLVQTGEEEKRLINELNFYASNGLRTLMFA